MSKKRKIIRFKKVRSVEAWQIYELLTTAHAEKNEYDVLLIQKKGDDDDEKHKD